MSEPHFSIDTEPLRPPKIRADFLVGIYTIEIGDALDVAQAHADVIQCLIEAARVPAELLHDDQYMAGESARHLLT